jgi:hypothetical protein
MATIKLQNNKVILKGTRISCECCDIGCCEEIVNYGYKSSIPPGGDFSDCISSTDCSQNPPATCCGASITGYIRSGNFRNGCKNLTNKIPKAKIFAGATVDNIGNIGGANFQPQGTCPSLFYVLGNDEVINGVEAVDNGNGTFYLKIPFTAANDPSCGPYGISSASVKWFFCDEASSGEGIGLSLL